MPDQPPLTARHCVPCEGGVPALTHDEIAALAAQVPAWDVVGGRLRRSVRFPDFRGLMACVNRIADLAEAEGHHPDFAVHYAQLDLELYTHAIGGLSENDFVLAAKVDALLSA